MKIFSYAKSSRSALISALTAAMNTPKRPISDMAKFKEKFKGAKRIVVLTGAGVSAESGVPTFRGAGGLWRTWVAQDLATPQAFMRNPSLVWEFYHYRREVMREKNPNNAHTAIAEAEEKLKSENKYLVVITQNIDELHHRAGSKNLIELHGSLFRTFCTGCGEVRVNRDSPICAALKDKGAPNPDAEDARIPIKDLPKCISCGGLLRPHVVWFGEGLDPNILRRVVYPAAMFAPRVASRGIPVAEFNIEATDATQQFGFYFQGPCGKTLPEALAL